jgi:hypothetical protein
VRVAGVVYDSLRGGPLVGATVHHVGGSDVAITDSAGRFRLERVPAGAGAFVVAHPLLDSLGLSGLGLPVHLAPAPGAADAGVPLTLATPSVAGLRARLCADDAERRASAPAPAGAPRAGDTSGVVYGEVRDAASGARLAGAVAHVRWVAVDTTPGGLHVRHETRRVRADSLGAWTACALPAGVPLEWRGVGGGGASGRAVVTLERALPLARLDLWLAPADTVAAPRDAAVPVPGAPQPALGTVPDAAPDAAPNRSRTGGPVGARSVAWSVARDVVRGIIRDSTGAPLLGARVTLDAPPPDAPPPDAPPPDAPPPDAPPADAPAPAGEARTGADGRFVLAGVPLGTQTLVVRALGYAPAVVAVAVRRDAPAEVDVTLRRVVTLAGVTAWARGGRLAQLFADIERRGRLGVSLAPDVSVYHRTGNLGRTLMTLPPEALPNLAGRAVPEREGCRRLTLLDGVVVRPEQVASLRPEDVIAIEIFRPSTFSPRWHGGLEIWPCSLVAVYTERWGERHRR